MASDPHTGSLTEPEWKPIADPEVPIELRALTVDMPPLPELDRQRKTRWDSPAACAEALDECYDELAMWQSEHIQAAMWLEELKGKLKELEDQMYPRTTGTVPERAAMLGRMVQTTNIWAEHQMVLARIEGCKKAFAYLDSRRSIAQSMLKRFQWEAEHDRFGRGKGQAGQGE